MLLGVPIVILLFAFLVGYFYWRSLRGLVLETHRFAALLTKLEEITDDEAF